MAYEFADCWSDHWVRIPEGWYGLKACPHLQTEPVILAATVRWRGKYRLVERAVGRNAEVATRLLREAALATFRGVLVHRKRKIANRLAEEMQIHRIPFDNLKWFEEWDRRSWFRNPRG